MVDNNSQSIDDYMKQTDQRLANLERNPILPFHIHNGFDMNAVNYSDLTQKLGWLNPTVYGSTAQTAANFNVFYIATFPITVIAFQEVHSVAGTDTGSVLLQLEKLTSTTAPGSGSNMLTTALSLKTTANSVQKGSLTTTLATVNLAVGDRLALKVSGTLTSLVNVSTLVAITF